MLQTSFIRDQFDTALKGLNKRGLLHAEQLLNEILSLDEERRNTQKQLDDILADSNKVAKNIGMLVKSGKKEEAEQAHHTEIQERL